MSLERRVRALEHEPAMIVECGQVLREVLARTVV
jgi:hypothetical protein